MTDGLMQIGEVATRVGLSLRTLRHWEEVGLVVPSARSAGGFRLYTESDVERMLLVKTLKPLDFTLEQTRELMATVDAARAHAGDDRDVTGGTGRGDTADVDDIIGRLAMFRAAADSRIEVLRTHVQGLELLSRELRRLAAQARRDRDAH